MKISVIVPVYNMEQYIESTITSIMNQSLKELEVLCVDDGSTDNTSVVLAKLQANYPNLYVFRQKNLGPGIARNKALKKAKGKYIAFIDGDDLYPEKNTLEELYDLAEQEGALICGGTVQMFDNQGFLSSYPKSILSKNGFVEISQFRDHWFFHRFIYNKDFLKKYRIIFPNYIRGEDPVFLLKAFVKAKKVYCVNKSTYLYRKNHKEIIWDFKKYLDNAKSLRDGLKLTRNTGMTHIAEFIVERILGITPYLYVLPKEYKIVRLMKECNRLYRVNFPDRKPPFYEKCEIEKYQQEHSMSYLQKRISQADKFLIYGAGKVAGKIFNFLQEKQIVPDAFVVSSVENNPKEINGIPVQCLDDFQRIKDSCFIIVSVGKKIQTEVFDILHKKGFLDIFVLDEQMLSIMQISEKN